MQKRVNKTQPGRMVETDRGRLRTGLDMQNLGRGDGGCEEEGDRVTNLLKRATPQSLMQITMEGEGWQDRGFGLGPETSKVETTVTYRSAGTTLKKQTPQNCPARSECKEETPQEGWSMSDWSECKEEAQQESWSMSDWLKQEEPTTGKAEEVGAEQGRSGN